MGLPNPGAIHAEVSQLGAKKKEIEQSENMMSQALKELQGRRNEIDSALQRLYKELENQEYPEQVKTQIREQITNLKNNRDSLDSQINSIKDKLQMLENSVEGIEAGISVRKKLLSQIAVAMAQRAKATQGNRELGRIKG